MKPITEPGVYDMPEDDYHADPALSATGICKLLYEPFESCPAKYRAWKDAPKEEDSAVFDFGKVAHRLVLGKGGEYEVIDPERYPAKNGNVPDGWTNPAIREARDIARAAGKTPMLKAEFEKASAMRDALMKNDVATAAFTNGLAEQSLFWRDEETGVMCKCRPDFLPEGGTIFANYKTARSAHPSAVSRAIKDYGYYVSAAHYLDGLSALNFAAGKPAYVFVFQEKEPPYLVTVAQLPPAALGWGKILIRKARLDFAYCEKTGYWPGYADNDVVSVDLPYFHEKHLERCHENGLFQAAKRLQEPVE